MVAERAEKLGRRVREVWIAWAKEQPNAKPSWLVEWDGLSEPDKEVDRRIGLALWGDFVSENAGLLAKAALDESLRARAEQDFRDIVG